MRRFALAAFALAFLAACQPAATELTDEMKSEIAQELTQVYAESLEPINQLDQEGWLSFYQDSEDLTFAANGTFFKSYSAFADTLSAHWAELASGDLDWGNLNIQVLAPNVAVVTTAFDYTGTDNAGAVMSVSGTWTAVWVKEAGSWKMVNVAETFPPAEAAPEAT